MTFMSKAPARLMTSLPMRPMPRMAIVLLASSEPVMRFHPPCFGGVEVGPEMFGDGDHEAEGVLGDGGVVDAGGEEDGDFFGGGVFDVDGVEADAVFGDDF